MENLISIEPIDISKAKAEQGEAETTLQAVYSAKIVNQTSYNAGANALKTIKGRVKELDTLRKSLTQPLDQAKKRIMDLFRSPIENYAKAEQAIKVCMIGYTETQERLRREREEKLRREATAEEERKRKALEARAKKAEEKGNVEKAEELREKKEEVHVPAPVLASTVEKPKGIHYIEKWSAEVVDKSKLPIEFLEPNMSALNRVANATKGQRAIPGVVFRSKKIVASGSA